MSWILYEAEYTTKFQHPNLDTRTMQYGYPTPSVTEATKPKRKEQQSKKANDAIYLPKQEALLLRLLRLDRYHLRST